MRGGALVAAVIGCAPLGSWGCEPTRDANDARPTPRSLPALSAPVHSSASAPAPSRPSRALEGRAEAPPPPALSAPSDGADVDPANDQIVAPPDAVEHCAEKLEAAGVVFSMGQLPLGQHRGNAFTCGANDAVVYRKGPTGVRLSPPALVTCRMALALINVEKLAQELAMQRLGSPVERIEHLGTYSCRKMVRFDWVSEHSYGNAIDIGAFVLQDGRRIAVKRHFGKLDAAPATDSARFLREFGEQAFDRNYVSVSLGPFWDALHTDHFHLDMARYRVDGSRP